MAEDSPGARIGRTLRALREEQMFSRPELAKRAGVGVATLDHIERGLAARPRRTTLEKLAKPLGTTVDDLIGATSPLGEALPVLDPWAMLAEKDAGRRRAALEVATGEERERYVEALDGAIERAEFALAQDAYSPPEAENERRAWSVRLRHLRNLHRYYVVLRHEAEPVVPPEPSEARELLHA